MSVPAGPMVEATPSSITAAASSSTAAKKRASLLGK
jgi:hypothetical protein